MVSPGAPILLSFCRSRFWADPVLLLLFIFSACCSWFYFWEQMLDLVLECVGWTQNQTGPVLTADLPLTTQTGRRFPW